MTTSSTNIRTTLILILVMAFSGSPAAGQGFNAGLIGGVTASQVDGDQYSGFKKLGITAGVFVNREIDHDIYWQMEIRYETRGAYETEENNSALVGFYKSVYRIVEVPLSVHYLFNGQVQPELGIAPEVLVGYASFDGNGRTDPALDPDNYRFGLSVFAGIWYWFIPTTGIGLRYTYSAVPFREPNQGTLPLRYRGYFHNVLSLNMAFKFRHN